VSAKRPSWTRFLSASPPRVSNR